MESNSQQHGNNNLYVYSDSKSRPVRYYGNNDSNCQPIAKHFGQQPSSVQGFCGITYCQRRDILHVGTID
jgi:hypothetical protein